MLRLQEHIAPWELKTIYDGSIISYSHCFGLGLCFTCTYDKPNLNSPPPPCLPSYFITINVMTIARPTLLPDDECRDRLFFPTWRRRYLVKDLNFVLAPTIRYNQP